jgi:hypothetical protein
MSSALALWVATRVPCFLRIKDEKVANGHARAVWIQESSTNVNDAQLVFKASIAYAVDRLRSLPDTEHTDKAMGIAALIQPVAICYIHLLFAIVMENPLVTPVGVLTDVLRMLPAADSTVYREWMMVFMLMVVFNTINQENMTDALKSIVEVCESGPPTTEAIATWIATADSPELVTFYAVAQSFIDFCVDDERKCTYRFRVEKRSSELCARMQHYTDLRSMTPRQPTKLEITSSMAGQRRQVILRYDASSKTFIKATQQVDWVSFFPYLRVYIHVDKLL